MRRVRLEKLCETKNAQAERSGRRIEFEALALRTRDFLARPFGFGVLRLNFRGSVEHVVQSSRVDRGPKIHPVILPQARTLCQAAIAPAALKKRHVSLKR